MLIGQQKIINRILKYIFSIGLILWVLISIYIGYQYVWFSSQQINSKGGTFVEGIFETTSFLPYLQNNFSSNFYQGLLFNSCLKYNFTGNNTDDILQEDLCKVSTNDNQIYEITLTGGMIWSDGTPVSIEDIFFTYDEIIRKNKRAIKSLDTFQNLKIEKEGNKLKIKFPTISLDNKIFFTNYILPRHILENATLQDYISNFSIEPTYTNCANIVSQSTDQYSLIFNLINCKDTNLNYYQIKNIQSFSEFANSIQEGKGSIVDVYINQQPLAGYVNKKLLTNKLVTVFFNTNSNILRVRVRRALGGFIKSHFYTTGFNDYITKYNDLLFNQFMTDGDNVEDFLKRGSSEEIIKQDLIDAGVTFLPISLIIDGKQPKYAFYTDTLSGTQYLQITLDKGYSQVYLDYKGKAYYDTSYNSKDKKFNYPIGDKLNNFGSGVNKYKIYGYENNKKIFVGSIDVYNMTTNSQINPEDIPIEKIKIIYYNNPTYEQVATNLKNIFSGHNLSQYFDFQKVDSAAELEGRITIGDYDIIINSIDMGLKKDIANLFITDNAQVNPSQYKNQSLAGYIKQYINSDDESTKSRLATQINNSYATDMPLIFLGKIFIPINVKENMEQKIFGSGQNLELYEYNRRNIIYNNIHLVNNISIDQKKIWNYENFSNFINQMFNK